MIWAHVLGKSKAIKRCKCRRIIMTGARSVDEGIRNIQVIDVTARMTKTKIDSMNQTGRLADFIRDQGLRGKVPMIDIAQIVLT